MRYFLMMIMLFLAIPAYSCTKYTEEQVSLIRAAYVTGLHKDYGYTLAAITIQEAFVGDRVIRMNPNDPSFGITHINFKTLQYLTGKRYYDVVEEAERLMYDDVLSWQYSIKKLDTIKGTWFNKWKRYNG